MKQLNQKILPFFSVLLFLLSISTVVFAEENGSIQIKGSDTMVNLGQAWAEAFMQENPSALIAVTGGGSGTGIAAAINGTCDIVQSSREMTSKEYELAKARGYDMKEVKVAIDAIAFVVHPENLVSEIKIEQLSDIFTGKIKNWKEIGGKDEPILVLSRERNSGTHVYVLEEVVRKGKKNGPEEFESSVLMMPSSQAIEQEVAENKTAIGYFGLGYLNPRIKALSIYQEKASKFVTPILENVLSGEYPVSRPLLFYLAGEAQGIVKQFIDFVLSEKGQTVVLDMHFVPLRKNSA
ncbi:MAG: PstS family phosphate ABC transporter substrate-binding protein [Candidatus Omnitrophica bacterium]|nr:PstS family phosphate ABC transporter substrate-binding protein [Candidatus Omnitrophota bacterium]